MDAEGFARTYCRVPMGMAAPLVQVEVHVSGGLPQFRIVGLPEAAVRESRDRVRSAILTSRFEFPQKRITVNLAPAELPKPGSRFDLAMAIAILAATKQLPRTRLANFELCAELGLDGTLRPVTGVLACCLAARKAERGLVIATENIALAGRVSGAEVYGCDGLAGVCQLLSEASPVDGQTSNSSPTAIEVNRVEPSASTRPTVQIRPQQHHLHFGCLSDIRGLTHAKRALEIAAAGGHSMLLIGPPGSGKTMLATRLVTILPSLCEQHAIELAAICSLRQADPDLAQWGLPPFRSPHHSTGPVALIGGGARFKPGEVSLAHRGVLFLDELAEFSRIALEALREPLESGEVNVARAGYDVVLPARFQLVCAMNPCPCGNLSSALKPCRCSADAIARYRAKLSGPLLDRIDIRVAIASEQNQDQVANTISPQSSKTTVWNSDEVARRVAAARLRQEQRFGALNSEAKHNWLQKAAIDADALQTIEQAGETFALSERGKDRALRVARTVADLDNSELVRTAHVLEALAYREFKELDES